MNRWIVGIGLTLTAVSTSQAQQVWVVGPPGPGVFSQDLKPAIDAAASGDIVLVKKGAGSGTPWSITGKSLTVIADRGVTDFLAAPGTISNLQASQRILLRGFSIFLHLTITGAAGPVWLEDCHAYSTFFTPQGDTPILTIGGCASVTMQRCSAVGYQVDSPSPPAFQSTSSKLTLYDCYFRGAMGPDFTYLFPTWHGAIGAVIGGGFTFASGTQFIGGSGGMYGCCNDNAVGEAGGAGLSLNGIGYFLNCPMIGGVGSWGPAGYGPDGPPFVGTPTFLTGFGHKFSITSPVRELGTAALTCIGQPGELAAVYISNDQMLAQPFLEFEGALVAGLTNATSFLLGQIGPAGDLTIGITAPTLPPGLQGATLFAQSYFFDPQVSYLEIGPASAVVVLDGSL